MVKRYQADCKKFSQGKLKSMPEKPNIPADAERFPKAASFYFGREPKDLQAAKKRKRGSEPLPAAEAAATKDRPITATLVEKDGVSAIERKLTGNVTLFPNTADAALFSDPRDAEINALIAAIPKDRDGAAPGPARIFGSLPVAPGADPATAFNAVTIPGLAADLNLTYVAWRNGNLGHTHSHVFYIALGIGLIIALYMILRKPRSS